MVQAVMDIEQRVQCNMRIIGIHRRFGAVIRRRISKARTRKEVANIVQGFCTDGDKWVERNIRHPYWPE